MGLDMYAFQVPMDRAIDTFNIKASEDSDSNDDNSRVEIFYWRKHHDLHGWMYDLAKKKGYEGNSGDFNCVYLRLLPEDLDALEGSIRNRQLPATQGFFFGDNPPDDESDAYDRRFIAAARDSIAEGYAVYYFSWW